MPDTAEREFLGMKIKGDWNSPGSDPVDQKPKEELAPLIEAVVNDPRIEAVRWVQYTPYFNDGEPCVFSISEYHFAIKPAKANLPVDLMKLENVLASLPGYYSPEEVRTNPDHYMRTDDSDEEWWGPEDDGSNAFRCLLGHERRSPTGPQQDRYGVAPELGEMVFDLIHALASGAFDVACQQLFGDHATVTIPQSGDIEIETYDHD